jgi:DNA primase
MTLPPGLDPDDVINANPEQWRQIVADAEPVVAYVIRVLTTGRDLDDPKVKTEIAATVLPLIEDVAQPIERDTYRQKLARVLRVDERSLVVRATGPVKRPYARPDASAELAPANPAAASAAPASAQAVSKLEAYCLGALLSQPDLLYKADRELQQLGLPKLAAGDFVAVEHQLIFGALSTALEQVDHDPAEYVRLHLDPALQPRLDSLRAAEAPPESLTGLRAEAGPTAVRTDDELLAAVLRLRKRTIDAWLRELRFLAEDAGEQGDPRAEAYQQEISRQAVARDRVDRALARRGKRGERPPKVGLR